MLDANADALHRIHGNDPNELQIWVANNPLGKSEIGFSSRVILDQAQPGGMLAPFQKALVEILQRQGDYKEERTGFSPAYDRLMAKSEIPHTKLEIVAQQLLDTAAEYGKASFKTRANGLQNLRFVHAIRFEANQDTDTAFIGMRTDTKDLIGQLKISLDAGKFDKDQLLAATKKLQGSKFFLWEFDRKESTEILTANFKLADRADLHEAASELLNVVATMPTKKGSFMTQDQYYKTKEALLLGG